MAEQPAIEPMHQFMVHKIVDLPPVHIGGFALDRVGTRHMPTQSDDTLDADLLPVGGNGLVIFNAEMRVPVRKGALHGFDEKVVAVCRHAWKVVHRLHPGLFIKGASIGEEPVWNPWEGLAMRTRRKDRGRSRVRRNGFKTSSREPANAGLKL